MMTDAQLAYRFGLLSEQQQIDQLARALTDVVGDALKSRYGRGAMHAFGSLSDLADDAQAATTAAVTSLLAPLASALGPTLSKISQPAVDKATASLQPMLKQELTDWAPTVAIIAGAVMGLFLLGGMLFQKATAR
jgi:hypothetical protein